MLELEVKPAKEGEGTKMSEGLKNELKKRVARIAERMNREPNDPEVLSFFAKQLNSCREEGVAREVLGEEEAFEVYQNFRANRKLLRSDDDLRRILEQKWEALYERQGFRKTSSRKSIKWITNWRFLRVDNLHAICFGVPRQLSSGRGYGIECDFYVFEEIDTKLGRQFYLRSLNQKKDMTLLLTQHFFTRYAERTGKKLFHYVDIIKYFMETEFVPTLDDLRIAGDSLTGHRYIAFENGMGLGHQIKTLTILKTFVDYGKVGNNQLAACVGYVVRGLTRLPEDQSPREMVWYDPNYPNPIQG